MSVLLNKTKTNLYLNGKEKKRSRKSVRKIGGLKGLYYKYCYLMGYLPKKRHRPLSPEMREAMRMCDKYSACARLLARESIDTIEDLQKYMEKS